MSAFGRKFLLGVSSVVLAAGILSVSSSAARASCGDYVHIGGDAPLADSHRQPMQDHAPCHGPNCSRAPSPLAPAVPLKLSLEKEPLAAALAAEALASPRRTADLANSGRMYPQFCAADIFRPPRS